MKSFKIFTHPSGTRVAVKQGWSWPGLFFGGIWALVKHLWLHGIVILAAGFGAGYVAGLTMPGPIAGVIANFVGLGICLFVSANGNQWREANLLSRGYKTDGELIEAENPDGALAQYLEGAAVPAV